MTATLTLPSGAKGLPRPSRRGNGGNLARIRTALAPIPAIRWVSEQVVRSQRDRNARQLADQFLILVARLTAFRQRAGISDRKLAERMGMPSRTWRRILGGAVNPAAWLSRLQVAVQQLNA